MKGLLDLEFGVEDDQPEADGEGVVGGSALEVVSDLIQCGFMAFRGERGEMGGRAGSTSRAFAADSGGVCRGKCSTHEDRGAMRWIGGSAERAARNSILDSHANDGETVSGSVHPACPHSKQTPVPHTGVRNHSVRGGAAFGLTRRSAGRLGTLTELSPQPGRCTPTRTPDARASLSHRRA